MPRFIYGDYNNETIEFVYDETKNEYYSINSMYKIIRRKLPNHMYDCEDMDYNLDEKWALVTCANSFAPYYNDRLSCWEIAGTGYICSTQSDNIIANYYDVFTDRDLATPCLRFI